MAIKEGLTRMEAVKELECLFAWSILYFESWQQDKHADIQETIEDHKHYYDL